MMVQTIFSKIFWSCFVSLDANSVLDFVPQTLELTCEMKITRRALKECSQMQGCTLETMSTPSAGWTHVSLVFPSSLWVPSSNPPCDKDNAIFSIGTNIPHDSYRWHCTDKEAACWNSLPMTQHWQIISAVVKIHTTTPNIRTVRYNKMHIGILCHFHRDNRMAA